MTTINICIHRKKSNIGNKLIIFVDQFSLNSIYKLLSYQLHAFKVYVTPLTLLFNESRAVNYSGMSSSVRKSPWQI